MNTALLILILLLITAGFWGIWAALGVAFIGLMIYGAIVGK